MIRRHHLVSLSLIAALAAVATPALAATPAAGWSVGALVEQGNAYANAGQRGRAILAYERAQVLAPRDPVVAAGLAQVRAAAGIAVPVPSRADRLLATLSANEWTWVSFGAAALACLGLAGVAWSIRRSAAGVLAIGAALVTMFAGAVANHVAPARTVAVIVTPDVARIAPFAAAEAAFSPSEGETVQIEQRRGDYVYIHDGDRAGWVPRAAVEAVVIGQPARPAA